MSLRDIFYEYRDRPFVFFRPGGNFGDELIYAGAEKLADDLKIDYRTLFWGYNVPLQGEAMWKTYLMREMKSRLDPSSIIYIHGSGAFNSMWVSANKLLQILYDTFPNIIIVGPTSCTIEPNYLKHYLTKDKRINFFARELVTYECCFSGCRYKAR